MVQTTSEKLFWLIVSVGILPASLASVIPPGIICVDFQLNSQFFCEVGIRRASHIVNNQTQIALVALLVLGSLIAVWSKKLWRFVALLPLAIAVCLPFTEIPESQQTAEIDTVTTDDKLSTDFLLQKIDEAVAVAVA